MNIGIRSSSCTDYKGSFGLDELCFVKSVGFNLVELNFNHANRVPSYDQAGVWRNEAQKLSMRLLAHAPTNFSISSLDMAEVESGIQEYREFLNNISVFGINKVVAHACVRASGVDLTKKSEHAANLIYALKKIAMECKKHQISFLVETMIPGRLSSNIENLIEVVDAVDSPWIKLCLDTNHSNLSEDIGHAIIKTAGRLGELHINDNHGLREEHLLPFDGIIDWDGFVQAVRTVGFDGDMIMEPSWTRDDDYRVMLRKAFDFAQKLSAMF